MRVFYIFTLLGTLLLAGCASNPMAPGRRSDGTCGYARHGASGVYARCLYRQGDCFFAV